METRLLNERFPGNSLLEDVGEVINEFFCARIVDGSSHEGRLFLTKNAFFFVSTFSSATSYDRLFGIDEIVKVIALQRMIPSVSFLMKQGGNEKEEFTNFHDLTKVVKELKSLLPETIPIEVKKRALHPKYNRLSSVPMKSQTSLTDHTQHPLKSKQQIGLPCPYFAQSGYCPRQSFCRFDHNIQKSSSSLDNSDNIVNSKSSSLEKLHGKLGELSRSISVPVTNNHTEQKVIPNPITTANEEGLTRGEEIIDGQENEKSSTPEPVSKHDKPYIEQLMSQIKTPPLPNSFVFGEQEETDSQTLDCSSLSINEVNSKRKKAVGDIFSTFENENDSKNLTITNGNKTSSNSDDQQKIFIPIQEIDPPPPYPGDKTVSFYDDYHSDEDEFAQEIPPMIMPSTLLIYPASHISREDINSGDKVILSVDILMACEQRQLTYPMAFCFKNKSQNKIVHCGVLEFTSPEPNAAYLPQWMFDHLCVTNGEEVDFEHVDLPKGTFVQLQPVSSAWLGVPYNKRTAIMEFQLRNFQTLTENTKVTITYELNRYTFKVLKCKPSKGISIVDADLTTDVVEPADFNRFHSIEEWQAENIPLDEPVHCSLSSGVYRHFVLLSLPGKELPSCIKVEVKHECGDPDLFLCQTCSTPSQSRYTWCSQDLGDAGIILNDTNDTNYDTKKSLFAGVVSLCEDTVFTICFHSESLNGSDTTSSNLTQGHVLRSATGSTTDETSNNDEPIIPPGHEQCSYCGNVMPQLRLLMHERHCAQSTFKCTICKQCFPKSAEKKHHYIAHELLTCECEVQLSQIPLHKHQLEDCVKRSVKCQFKWCQLSFPLDQMQNHESRCGRKQVSCPVCFEEVTQLELEMHLEAFHLVEVDKLDWTKPISSQTLSFKSSEPNFKCHCGAGFEFQDDLQVHQLTECILPQPVESEGDLLG